MSENKEVLDITYYQLSQAAYRNDKRLDKEVVVVDNGDNPLQTWKVDETFHDKQTGMDAVVFKREVNGKTQVMVAFRGTEGDTIFKKNSLGIPMPGEGMKDGITDLDYIVGGKKVHDPAPAPKAAKNGPEIYWNEENKRWEYHNQFEQAEKVMKQVMEKYKGREDVEVYTTGHSLGGALAEYVAAFNESVRCLSWNAPSVKHLLPPDLQERVNNGEFKGRIMSIVHSSDSIGYGPLAPYGGHIGSTYTVSPPLSKGALDYLQKMPLPGQMLMAALKFKNSISGPGYHYQKNGNFQFGKDGYLSNSYLMNLDTREMVSNSPGKLLGGGEVRVVVEHLEESVKRMKQNAQEFQDRVPKLISNMMTLLETAESKRLEAKITDIRAHVEHLSFWYIRTATEIANFIDEKLHAYKKADGQE